MDAYRTYFSRPVFKRVRLLEEQTDRYKQEKTIQEEGVLQCGKCKSNRVSTTSKQIRAADESMSVFCFCKVCGNR